MPKLFLGESHSREKALIMDMRMLRFSTTGNFVSEIPYSIDYVARGIREVIGVSILSCMDTDNVEIAMILNNEFKTFTISGRPSVIITKLQSVKGLVDALIRHGDGYLQSFLLYDINSGVNEQVIKNTLTS